jgi:hypothetical protein
MSPDVRIQPTPEPTPTSDLDSKGRRFFKRAGNLSDLIGEPSENLTLHLEKNGASKDAPFF